MSAWQIANLVVTCIFCGLTIYQVLYILIGFFAKVKYKPAKVQHTYGILIAGRNEEKVIGQLLDSILKQDYDISKLKIFVCADNCDSTDKTAEIARSKGAVVYERFDKTRVSKSYALDFLLSHIAKDYPDYEPDAFFVFDADNLLEKNYIKLMNDAFDSGEKIVTSYRSSKNYGDSIMSMGSSIHFIRECRFLHTPRTWLGFSTHVSGTGFLVSSEILNQKIGWKYGKLTEDLEFSCDNLIKGERVAYCDDAIFYDEQPKTWRQTYRQRMRWQKGTYQCAWFYGLGLLGKFFTNFNFAAYDFAMFFLPFPLISVGWGLVNFVVEIVKSAILIVQGAAILSTIAHLGILLLVTFVGLYLGLFLYGSLAVIRDWKRIPATKGKKIASMFAYPIFMICLIPICILALFKKVEWKPIHHSSTTNIDELQAAQNSKKA